MNYFKQKKLITISSLFLLNSIGAYAAERNTGYTASVGGTGGTSESISCPANQRITAIGASHDGVSVISLNLRCEKIGSDGKIIPNSKTWSKSTASNDLTKIANKRSSVATCPSGKFVYAFRAKANTLQLGFVRAKVLTNIAIKCKAADSNGETSGNLSTRSTSINNSGNYSGWKYCPDKGFAFKIKVKRGSRVDSMKLSCKKGTPTARSTNFNVRQTVERNNRRNNSSQSNPIQQGFYEAYKAYFRIVADRTAPRRLSAKVRNAIKDIGINSQINQIKVSYSPFLAMSQTAMTDCNNIYFSQREIIRYLTDDRYANRLTRNDLIVFVHEIGHTKQCASSGRSSFANRWFKELGPSVIASIVSLNPNPNVIHDKMPLERQAESFMVRHGSAIQRQLR